MPGPGASSGRTGTRRVPRVGIGVGEERPGRDRLRRSGRPGRSRASSRRWAWLDDVVVAVVVAAVRRRPSSGAPVCPYDDAGRRRPAATNARRGRGEQGEDGRARPVPPNGCDGTSWEVQRGRGSPSDGPLPGTGHSERDVAVRAAADAAALHGVVDGPRDGRAGRGRLDDLVDDADLDGLVDAAGDPLVLGGQLGLDLRRGCRGRPRPACAGAGCGPRRPRP